MKWNECILELFGDANIFMALQENDHHVWHRGDDFWYGVEVHYGLVAMAIGAFIVGLHGDILHVAIIQVSESTTLCVTRYYSSRLVLVYCLDPEHRVECMPTKNFRAPYCWLRSDYYIVERNGFGDLQ